MSIQVTSVSRDYSPDKVRKRYATAALGAGLNGIRWCEVGDDRRFDLRQGTCNPSDLPEAVLNAALDIRLAGIWPSYVDWPL